MSDPIALSMADASRLFRRVFDTQARTLGLTGQQWRVLGIVSRNPGINQGAAAELLEVEPITLSRMIDRLSEAELVERRAAPNDRRAWSLHLTDQAQPVVERMRTIATRLMDNALDGFSSAEQAAFADYVERFRVNISKCQDETDEQAA